MTSVAFFELVLALVAAALALSLVAGRLHLPPAAALVVGGMALALIPGVPAYTLDPSLIMVLFLPPLLLASAYFTVWRDFKASLTPILLLSIGAVVFTTAAVAVVAKWIMPSLPWAACVTLGAIVSPPDAVAAKAVLARVKLPARLVTILEGESLVNDASGLVIYKFAVAATLTGMFSGREAATSFVWLIVGGVALGLLVGLAWTELVKRLHDPSTIIASSFLGAWASYLLAEELHASGVLATVACGAVVGLRSHQVFNASIRVQAAAVWGLVVFVMEALVFVMIGLALRGVLDRHGGELNAMQAGLPLAIGVTAAAVAARFVYIGLAAYAMPGRRDRPPPRIAMIIGWAGMRGVVTLTAALALPLSFPGRDAILFASFVVILFTVLVQGVTLAPLIRLLKITPEPHAASEVLDLNAARIAVAEASLVSLEALTAEENGDLLHPRLADGYRRRIRAMSRLRDEGAALEVERSDHFAAALGALASGRGELIRLHRAKQIHDSVLRVIEDELDLEELRLLRAVEA